MRSHVLSSLALALLLVPGPALAATSAGFGAANAHCYTSTALDSMTYPQVGWLDVPGHECSLTTSGAVSVVSCTAGACQVTATAAFSGAWNVPTYGSIQAVVARDYYNGSAICAYFTGDPLQGQLPNNGGSCSGTAAPLPVFVAAGQCKPVYVFAAVQMFVVVATLPSVGYVALTYTWSRIDSEFSLCRDAAGVPDLQHVTDYPY
ncbi:MAG TPA: hypothetical protein VGR28_08395 [Candidatus Thermoplasmatota archaeon]|nr:hypothetical protein [Candidatus Thermoplasmatota archaeon]